MNPLGAAFAVLFVGHSLFGPTAPTMLEQALEAGPGGVAAAQIINGAPLRYNWENGSNAEGVNAREVLAGGEVTHLILTEAVPLDNHLQWSATHEAARNYADAARAANGEVLVYVQETWHSLRSGTGVEVAYDAGADVPWRARIDADLPKWEGIVDAVSAGGPAALIPAGQALGLLHDRIAAGAVPGLTGIEAVFDDDIHLNDLGHYFVTMVQYAVVTGENPAGLPFALRDRFGGAYAAPAADLAAVLQEIAWEAVQAYGSVQRAAPAATRAPPVRVALPDAPAMPDGSGGAVAVGLASVTDWNPAVPFLDLMKTARPLFGHVPGRWGGFEHAELSAGGYLDADGWPRLIPRQLSSIGTLILTDLPEDAGGVAGRYVLRFDGTGIVEVAGRARNVRYGPGEVRFDYAPGPGPVDIRIQRSAPGDPVRAITVVAERHLAAFEAGAVFNPDWTARLAPFAALRFMDWGETNNSDLSAWADRPLPSDASWAGGVPLEVMVRLANELGKDAWFNVPHLADDDYAARAAALIRDGLAPERAAYVEFSNEVWNWSFEQARWADARAQEMWGARDVWMQAYGARAADVARIFSAAFERPGAPELVNVISSQTGWLGLEEQALMAPLADARPYAAFDAYAITGYFGGVLGLEDRAGEVDGWLDESRAAAEAAAAERGLSGAAAQDFVAAHRFDLASAIAGRELIDGAVSGNAADTVADLTDRVWPHHAAVAADLGLDLIMYEGGSHVVGLGPRVESARLTEFFHHFNYSAEMGALYQRLLAGWQAVGGGLFNAYSDVYAPSKWGSWGALRHLGDANLRFDALEAYAR